MYRRPPTYVRNDALTPGNHNQLAVNARELEQAFRTEHIESSGEHNTPTIARTLGSVTWDTTKYGVIGFNGDMTLPSTAAQNGRVTLALAAGRYEKDGGPLYLQNASATGATKPCLSWGRWFDDTRIEIYSTSWLGTLGAPATGGWDKAGDEAAFHLGVHSKVIAAGALNTFGDPVVARQGLRVQTTDAGVNQLIQGGTDLEVALRVNHTAGAHDCREVAKLWAHVQWNGRFGIIDQASSRAFRGAGLASVDAVSTGVAEVLFDAPLLSTNYQVFVDVDYARLTGTTDDYFIACVPQVENGTRSFRIYLYKRYLSGAGEEYFDRASDVDFHLWVYDDL